MNESQPVRRHLLVTGIVQGVGFRPFVYLLARRHQLAGWVLNSSQGVEIEVEGPSDAIQRFTDALRAECPPLARVSRVTVREIVVRGDREFIIRESAAGEAVAAFISPDVATCADCLRELLDPPDRRYRYPFINCTNCGPRYTILQHIPYDRPNTTMRVFKMCPACQAEYDNPSNRRFHAQPNACWHCGPRLQLLDAAGQPMPCADPIAETQKLLAEGKTVALKGLGGFHLACDAANDAAVRRLRERKRRQEKPFAVMSADLEAVRQYCQVSEQEAKLLACFQRPIVLLRKQLPNSLAAAVAPSNRRFGVMLPYTPIHHLLLADKRFLALVMTSGNLTDEPIAIDNAEAVQRLSGIADAFLVHNRDIGVRSDDSVTRVRGYSDMLVIRRARGYAPEPVLLKGQSDDILAVGPELKTTVCVVRGEAAFLSQHIGDLKTLEAHSFFHETLAHLTEILETQPPIVAHDLHPGYLSTQFAQKLAAEKGSAVRLVGVQHHHAHIASCMAEHGLDEKVIGVSWDGTGYGTDGKIWGGEFLVADLAGFERVGHFLYVPLPGGDAAIRDPRRTALAFLHAAYDHEFASLRLRIFDELPPADVNVLVSMMKRRFNAPETSSMGRLFDTVAALTGVCDRNTYEGQAAMELEAVADESCADAYPHELQADAQGWIVDSAALVRGVVDDLKRGEPPAVISAKFHNTLVNVLVEVCWCASQEHRLKKVVLSGGVFQNEYLLTRAVPALRQRGLAPYEHHIIPPNDGGIALGQAAVARSKHLQ